MAVPPSYSDLGKSANDLFSKGFNIGDVKLEVSTTAQCSTSFKASATSHGDGRADVSARKVSGNLEVKREVYKQGNRDVSLTSKWATDNTVVTTLAGNNFLVDNLKLTAEGNFAPHSGKHTGKVKVAYKRPHFHTTEDVHFKTDTIVGSFSAVAKHCGFYAGYQATYDQKMATLKDSNFALGFSGSDFTIHTSCLNHGTEFRGSLFHSINPKVDMGVQMKWAAGGDGAHFGIASKYNCCPGVALRSKFNSEGELGLSYKQELNKSVDVTVSAQVDTKALALPSHRLGLALDFAA